MSTIGHFVRLPAARRSYSYFSSRSGGGRYFNSAKPPKAPVVANGTGTKKPQAEASGDSKTNDNVQTTAPPAKAGSNSSSPNNVASASSAPGSSPCATTSASSITSVASPPAAASSVSSTPFVLPPTHFLSAKDFKMHHFFSLHRPLLLINQPTTLFRSVSDNHPLSSSLHPSEAEIERKIMQLQSGMFGPPPTTNVPSSTRPSPSDTAAMIDADAEAARQLTRALTMNKAGAAVSWESTLKTLGLDVSKEADRVGLAQQFEKEWQEVLMDSTKRKRRKKMKKHKLKKRRRATRSERMRLK